MNFYLTFEVWFRKHLKIIRNRYFINFIDSKMTLIKIWIQSSILVIVAIGIRGCPKAYFFFYCPRTPKTRSCLVFTLFERFYTLKLIIRCHLTSKFIQRIFLFCSNLRSIHIDFLKNRLIASLWVSLRCLRLFLLPKKFIENYVIIVLWNKTT